MASEPVRSPVETILVIDDDLLFLDLAATLLEEEGYHVVLCQDVCAGLATLEQERIDLAILDLRFETQESGWDVLEFVQGHPAFQTLPVLVCSAAVDDLRGKQALWRARNIAVLAKPFEISEFCRMVSLTLQNRSTHHGGEMAMGAN